MMKPLWESLRPHQWIKNLFVFAPLLFSGRLLEFHSLWKASLAFLLFCFLSGAVYLINDLIDREEDRKHPSKSKRPLASGRLSTRPTLCVAGMLAAACATIAFGISPPFFWTAAAFFALHVAYSLRLKRIVILDVFAIAGGFGLRILAGAAAIRVEISSWLILCTIFLSLFIALGKRRQELVACGSQMPAPRQVLSDYSPLLLDQMMAVVTASTVMAYGLYTLSEETVARVGSRKLAFTLPFVLYGILRYLFLVYQKGAGEEPERLLATDWPLAVSGLLWALTAAWVIYG